MSGIYLFHRNPVEFFVFMIGKDIEAFQEPTDPILFMPVLLKYNHLKQNKLRLMNSCNTL